MNIKEIKRDAINSDSQSRLFEITLELIEEISKCHIELAKTQDNLAKVKIKGKMTIFSSIQKVIDKRIEEVSKIEKENTRTELLTNRQFRKAAELVLKKETFERIRDLSLMNYKKLKEQKNQLKANKLE